MPVLGLAGCHVRKLQVHGGDQSPLPPLWNSFIGTGIHNGPVSLAYYSQNQKESQEKLHIVSHLFRWFTHTPRSSGAFLEDASRSRMTVFSQGIKMCRAVQRPARSGPMLLCAVIGKIIGNFLIRCVALSQNNFT